MVFLPTLTSNLFVSWASGWLAFFHLCSLPLLFGYLSVLAAPGCERTDGTFRDNPSGWPSLSFFLCFLGGFVAMFMLLALPITGAGRWAFAYQEEIRRFCSLAPILLGLRLTGLTASYSPNLELKIFAFVCFFFMGSGWAAGWNPCPDKTLTAVLIFIGSQDNLAAGILLLSSYLLGLISPFLLGGLALNTIFALFLNIYRGMQRIEIPVGWTLILSGVLLFFRLPWG